MSARELSQEMQAAVRLGHLSESDAQRMEFGARPSPKDATRPYTPLPLGPSAIVTQASDITPRPLDPVWDGVLWAGKPTLLAGDPGLGKSMLTCNIAARVTTGEPWPCSAERREPADVVILSAEDDPEDTIVPRLLAVGADLSRIVFVRGITELTDDGERNTWLSLDKHLEQLAVVLRNRAVRLLIIDPLSAYLGRADSHNEGDVRTVLAGLADLATEHRAAVLAIRHLRKSESTSAQQKIIGSIAFTAAARAVYVVVRDPDDEDLRLLLCAKNNLAPDTAGYRYCIKADDDGIPYAHFDDERESRTADEVLGSAPDRRGAVDGAADWLCVVLAEGPVASTRMRELAAEAGHSWRTVERARSQMGGIKIERSGGLGAKGRWQWRLITPPDKTATPARHAGGVNGHSVNTGFQPSQGPKAVTAKDREGGGVCARCRGEGCAWCGS